MEYYKKIDKSIFKYGITITNKHIPTFIPKNDIPLGKSRNVKLLFKNKEYDAFIINVNRKNASNVYQLRWDQNIELITELKKEFIQSYFAIESQNFDAKMNNEYYITNLLGGNQEVLIFRPINNSIIELETFIKITTPYDNIFKRLVDENVFGWLSSTNRDYLIVKTTKWFDKNELKSHEDSPYVVYYLIDDINKEFYIGSAIRLGDRVKVGRDEIPGWNLFKYDIIHPKYHHLLRRIEFHTIGAFASIMKNNGKVGFFELSNYKLVNKNWSKKIN